MKWIEVPRTSICAALSYSGDYVISHRDGEFNAHWRPEGRHVFLDCFKTEADAKAAVEAWDKGPRETYAQGLTEFAVGFKRWWDPK